MRLLYWARGLNDIRPQFELSPPPLGTCGWYVTKCALNVDLQKTDLFHEHIAVSATRHGLLWRRNAESGTLRLAARFGSCKTGYQHTLN